MKRRNFLALLMSSVVPLPKFDAPTFAADELVSLDDIVIGEGQPVDFLVGDMVVPDPVLNYLRKAVVGEVPLGIVKSIGEDGNVGVAMATFDGHPYIFVPGGVTVDRISFGGEEAIIYVRAPSIDDVE